MRVKDIAISLSWVVYCFLLPSFAVAFPLVLPVQSIGRGSSKEVPRVAASCICAEHTVVILYHKPPNIITSHSSNDSAPEGAASRMTVYDDIMSMKGFLGDKGLSFQDVTKIQSKLHAIGRLDADTSGLLLLTNDGGLVHHVTNPTVHGGDDKLITKTYEAVIMGRYENDSPYLDLIRKEGVDIGAKYGGLTKPAQYLEVLGHPSDKSTLVSITIAEGKNRQVRRMFHAIRSGVMKLKRVKVGSILDLDGLNEGEWRLLSSEEIRKGLGWAERELLPLSQVKSTPIPSRRQGRSSSRTPRRKKT